jgi:hypothetical protein
MTMTPSSTPTQAGFWPAGQEGGLDTRERHLPDSQSFSVDSVLVHT